MTTKPDRIACCVPFRRRTAARKGKLADCEEIICGKHWRQTPQTLRRRLQKIRRLTKRAVMRGDLGSQNKAWRLDWAVWEKIKAAAIETAAGVN